jgi:putative sigma-54 modulation protein
MPNAKLVHVNIAFRNTDATDSLKTYATDKVSHCLKKYIHHDTEVHLVLRVEKNRHIAEIDFNVDGGTFKCKEESTDLYASIDSLAHSVAGQLRKHKEKLTRHK